MECQLVSFGNFTLDAKRRRLSANGKPVELDPKPFELLTFLIARRDAAVSRDEILAHVWSGRVVDASNVAVQLSALRNTLKQAGSKDQLILTLPGPCYRFVGDVTFADVSPALPTTSTPLFTEPIASKTDRVALPLPGSRRSGSVALGIAALLAALVAGGVVIRLKWSSGLPPSPRLSIVVTPFRNPSPDRTQDHLADAITDDLTSDLAHIPASTVIARESAEAVRNKTPQQVGRDLHVRYMLSGTLYPEDLTYRITAELIDTATGAQLWTKQFAVPQNRLSIAREEIVRRIASALHFQLDQLESTRSVHDRPDNPDALDLFFRARARLDWDGSLAGLSAAQRYLESAIREQPNFADAQAQLGWLLLHKVTSIDDPDEDQDYAKAKDVIGQALAISPQNVVALAARARLYQTDGKCDEAMRYARTALDIEESNLNARDVMAGCAMTDIRLEDAALQYESMLQLNPASPNNRPRYLALGYIRLIQGHIRDGLQLLLQAAEEDETVDPFSGLNGGEQAAVALIAAYELDGQHAPAVAAREVYAQKWPGRSVWRVRAFFPKKWLELPGFQRELTALADAGMPLYTVENEPGGLDKSSCDDGDFAPTPKLLPGGHVLLTSQLLHLEQSGMKPLIIDVGRGAGVIDGAVWRATTNTQLLEDFVVQVANEKSAHDKRAVIIVAGDGSTGCGAYKAAIKLIQNGFLNVGWYRGGEEAWYAANQKSKDLRLQ